MQDRESGCMGICKANIGLSWGWVRVLVDDSRRSGFDADARLEKGRDGGVFTLW